MRVPPFSSSYHLVLPRHQCLNVSEYLIVGYSSYWQELIRRILMLPLMEISQNRHTSPRQDRATRSNQERWQTGPVNKDSPMARKWVQFTRWGRVTIRLKQGPSCWLGIREEGGKLREEMHRLMAHGRIKSRIKQMTTFAADGHILAITHT